MCAGIDGACLPGLALGVTFRLTPRRTLLLVICASATLVGCLIQLKKPGAGWLPFENPTGEPVARWL
jgi:hypothetical protein